MILCLGDNVSRNCEKAGGGFTSRSPLMNVGLNGVRRVASASETQAGGALHQLKVRWPGLVIG
jgi:hypothetical protein